MSYHLRIAAWVLLSASLPMLAMATAAYFQLEQEMRARREDAARPYSERAVHHGFKDGEIDDIPGEMARVWAWTAIPLIAFSLGAGLLLARRSLRPVREINRQLAAMRSDAWRGNIAIPDADPSIADLANHLNVLLDRAGTACHEMADFSSRVAHELRTPLMLLRLRLENAPPGMPPAFQQELQDELARLARFVERSLLAVKAEQGTLQPVEEACDLGGIIRDVADSYQLLAAERGLEVTLETDPEVRITADPDLLRQALHGLLENAVRYAAGRLRVTCLAGAPPCVEIRNDCDPDTIALGGLGLGLRLVTGICKACGWRFEKRETHHDFHASLRF